MTFIKGQSGNPSGRKSVSTEIRKQIATNGEKGVERLRQILEDDKAFGKDGWLSGKEQIAVAALAQDRAYGRAESVSVTHTHSGSVGMTVHSRLKEISEKLPERLAQQRIIDANVDDVTLDPVTEVTRT